jgi:hypothetical protein
MGIPNGNLVYLGRVPPTADNTIWLRIGAFEARLARRPILTGVDLNAESI